VLLCAGQTAASYRPTEREADRVRTTQVTGAHSDLPYHMELIGHWRFLISGLCFCSVWTFNVLEPTAVDRKFNNQSTSVDPDLPS
jgi:hypothetical protein